MIARKASFSWSLGSVLVGGLTLGGASAGESVSPAPVEWKHLSSKHGGIPAPPGGSKQQTGALVGDFDGDGLNDFILGFRQKPPALVWYRRSPPTWETYPVETDYLTIEAGGAAGDIDGDGDLDLVFGGDWESDEVWWWENPSPAFRKDASWRRRPIKSSGGKQHHDQAFGDFLGSGSAQLAFWNQTAQTIFLARIPPRPRDAAEWVLLPLATGFEAFSTPYTEGMSAFDVNDDGKIDLLAYNSWFEHTGGISFKRTKVADAGGLIFAARFKPSRCPQIVISPGDGTGPVRLYECEGEPGDPAAWAGRDLLERDVIHGHSLQVGDINQDGRLDIFVAEMAKWHDQQEEPDHAGATAWILYGRGNGSFTITELVRGHGWHEARLADLDGDGDLDLLNKPYTWETPRVDLWLNLGIPAPSAGSQ